jgi:hypothetical protein
MGDLRRAAVVLDLAADDAGGADRQGLLQVVDARMEEHQLDRTGIVAADHLVGRAGAARRDMSLDAQRQGRDHAVRRGRDLGGEAAVDQARRQVPQQVDDVRAGQLLDQLAEPRPDAGQRRDRGEQREQDLRTHVVRNRLAKGLTAKRRGFIS